MKTVTKLNQGLKTAISFMATAFMASAILTNFAHAQVRPNGCRLLTLRYQNHSNQVLKRTFAAELAQSESSLRRFIEAAAHNPSVLTAWNNYVAEFRQHSFRGSQEISTELAYQFYTHAAVHGGTITDINCRNGQLPRIVLPAQGTDRLSLAIQALYAQVSCGRNNQPAANYRSWLFSGSPDLDILYNIPQGRRVQIPAYTDPETHVTIPARTVNVTHLSTRYPFTLAAEGRPVVQTHFQGNVLNRPGVPMSLNYIDTSNIAECRNESTESIVDVETINGVQPASVDQ